MKSSPNSIRFLILFASITLLLAFAPSQKTLAQGFNNNEWIFGNCPTGGHTYLSFGKGKTATVQKLPAEIENGSFNNAIAIDPITGQPLFYTNGELVYDYSGSLIEGNAPGLRGNFQGRQTVATGFLEYNPNGNKLFYIFYLSLAGQLQYALVDMNALGQATGNQRPLGQITTKDQVIGPGQGAVLVVKSPSSPSYLISFAGGNLQARRLEATAGTFTLLPQIAIPIVPKAMIFDESTGNLLLLPQNPGEDLLLLLFDTAAGTFGTPQALTNTGGTDPIHGAAFSPDGNFIYFSRGNKLLRLPTNAPTAVPEELPLSPGIVQVYDIKTGPDGALYYLYEEGIGGPQLIGRVSNPNESNLTALVVDEDPFAGTDFCGRIFPIFAPNADIDPSIDFTWDPEAPCANNPVQLTSEIIPQNYRPLSFLWEFSPPLTDEDGNPLPADFTQEHFLVPAEAAQGSSIEVSLTVTLADSSTKKVTKSITLTENELQANFSPSDTTLCESCIDLDPLLQAQSGESGGGGTGGGTGGGAGGGAGGGTNYEYFWSNKREEGWIPKGANEVCKPGLYWVLVREPGSSCYAYAEIRVKMWDVPDQSNNIWYFGDGAGLDFNPDPDDENAPVPRPIAEAHPQNIPAGTSTISDQAGQVLFFTDGQSVWDLNGTLMENGSDIGGSNTSSQAVLAVAVPTQSTLFYLFTTQAATSGGNEVRFSLVDIKAENTTGVGNVVTKNNFLFSPSTEHSAALSAGDTTWAVFHELGNNTFRAYPVSSQGIGQSVLSSVGSSHGFNSGVGAMKFSPDGTKLAITISEGGCNRVELFEFNQQTGVLTEYALVDLGCGGDGEVYGLEFSADSDRIFLSYRNGTPVIEEYIIKEAGPSCPTCFAAANTPALRAACILSTKKVLSGTAGLNLGALQIASDGQIYVAVVGSNRIGQIQVGTGCTAASTFNQDAVEAMPGTSNLGLPSFVQNSGSSIPEPSLGIPPTLCLDPVSGASASFEGGGEPDIDSYFWTITHEDGTIIRSNFGGPGDQFQNLEQIFTKAGTYSIVLRVDRCAEIGYFTAEGTLEIVAPPTLTLASDATLCEGSPVTITAIDDYDPADGLYDFLWTNAAGDVFGDANSNSITVTEESIYTVIVQYRASLGAGDEEEAFFESCAATASIFVGPAFEFDLTQTATEVCYEETSVTFAPNTPITGEWFYERDNNGVQVPLGSFFELDLEILSLPGPGLYTLTFLVQDPILASCKVSKTLDLVVHELPVLLALATAQATDCATADGAIEITLQAAVNSLQVLELGLSFPAAAAGDVIPITGLLPGLYTVVAENAAGCSYTASVTVVNSNPPDNYDFSVLAEDEICSATGIAQGGIRITFSGGPQVGTYKIIRQGDGFELTDELPNDASFLIPVSRGNYMVEILDPNGCSISDENIYTVNQKIEVQFSVPAVVDACVSFTFTPSGPELLTYALTGPTGVITAEANGSYILTQSGAYSMLGRDPAGIDCPKVLPMTVNLSPALDFEVSPPIVDCLTGIRFEAILENAVPADVIFLWKNDLGIIVGRRQEFVPSRSGNYTLEVQPAAGGLCPTKQIPFTATILPARLTLSLEAQPFCVDQTTTTIEVKANLTTVEGFEWFLASGSTRSRLPQFTTNLIEVSQEGTYEVVLRSIDGCELGRANVVVVKSNLNPPVLPSEEIGICALEGKNALLSPGAYASYSWSLDGKELSQDPTFSPEVAGTYTLTVGDLLGCSWAGTFTVVEDCQLKVTFPNAMVLEDPNRNFLGYANEYIDDVEVFIYNRWGELIFYCSPQNLEAGQSFCPWDGRVGGKLVPTGTYVVLVRFTSRDQNLTQTETKALTIIH